MQDRFVKSHHSCIMNILVLHYIVLCLILNLYILTYRRMFQDHLRIHDFSEREVLRPGLTRLSLPYFLSQEVIDYVVKAVVMVAEHAWRLLPLVYMMIGCVYNGFSSFLLFSTSLILKPVYSAIHIIILIRRGCGFHNSLSIMVYLKYHLELQMMNLHSVLR